MEKVHWLPLAEQAVNTIYRLAEHPDTVCGDIVKKLAAAIIKAGQSDETTQGGEDGETQPEQEGIVNLPCVEVSRLGHFKIVVEVENHLSCYLQKKKKL